MYFDYVVIGHLDFIFCVCFTSFHTHTSSNLHLLILCLLYFILAVRMHECLEKHLCTGSKFSIALLNGTCFLSDAKLVLALPSKIKLN